MTKILEREIVLKKEVVQEIKLLLVIEVILGMAVVLGIKVILGEENGVQAILNRKMTHLPEFGGCLAHDCSNVLKSAVDKLHPDLLKIYHSLPSYILSQSIHRWRNYLEFCSEVGLDPRNPPKMFEVRFRVLPKMAQWMERDD